MKPFLKLQSVDEILGIIFDLPVLPGEMTALGDALGRRAAKAFYAPHDLPGFRRSTMDGYAVIARDTFGASESNPALLETVGSCQMGKLPKFNVAPGQAAQIFTGAPLPDGADAVVMIEHTRETGKGQIEVARSVAPGDHVIEPDEDAAQGQEVIPVGKLLRPQEIGILAAFGAREVEVARKPRVAIISTGDEIVPLDAPLAPGQIRDVNAWSLEGVCKRAGAITRRLGIASDEPDALREMLQTAACDADVALVSGGSSAGMRDHAVEAFLALPDSRILVHGAAISPGKPFIFGLSGNVCLLGMPGHVTSALICAKVFLEPLLNHLQGLTEPVPKPWFDATLSRSVASAQGRRDYIRCRLLRQGDEYAAVPLLTPSSVLGGLLEADGLVICPENSEGLAKGQKVRVYPI